MFIDPNFETLSGESLMMELSARASGQQARSPSRFNPFRRFWHWAVKALTGRRAEARS